MRIAVVHTAFTTKGGGERFLYEVFSRLRKAHEIHFFCNGISEDTFNFKEFNHTIIPAKHDFLGKFVAYYEAKALKKSIELAVKWKPDLIWLNRGYYYVNWITRKYGINVVPYVHYPIALETIKGDLPHRIYRRLIGIEKLEEISFADAPIVLCNSKYTESAIKREQPLAKTKVVYPGVDHRKFFPTWEDEGYLYYNSRFQKMKNQELAIEVARRTGYRLILSGFLSKNNLEYFEAIKRKAERYNVRIIANPSDEEVIKLLQKCSIFLFPSIGEHFGIAPVEAMACGKVVIAHNSGGTVETVGEAGILCGDDPEDWVRNVKYLMENTEEKRSIGRRAFEFSKEFDWEKTVEKISRILDCLGK
ncbi:MAG: glycosyltransferase family 4 protein [Thermoproteota archaeon]